MQQHKCEKKQQKEHKIKQSLRGESKNNKGSKMKQKQNNKNVTT